MGKVEYYEIRVGTHLQSDNWSYWFEGFIVCDEANGETVLSGPVIDQAALHGVLAKVRDLNLKLVSVNQIDRVAVNRRPTP